MTTSKSFSVSRTAVTQLFNMLTTMRPAGSKEEVAFLREYLVPLNVNWDKYGNGWKKIGDAPVAWSCHTDTVHRLQGRQLICQEDNMIKLHESSKSNCLGADDTAGVWLMCEMIKAKRPGLYLFHRAEECGGHGSKYISTKTPDMVKGIECVIALDRKDVDSVITRQWGGRCCSDEFGKSLAAKIDLDFKLDTGGSFTDSANYVDLVGECTNLSVGYYRQHTNTEELDIVFLCKLRESLLAMDTRDLVFKRKAGEKEQYHYNYRGAHRGRGSNNNEPWWKSTGSRMDNNSGWYSNDYPPTQMRSPNYCPAKFDGYFWDDNKYVKCTHTAWEDRCKELKIYGYAPANADRKPKGVCVKCGAKYDTVTGVKCYVYTNKNYCGGDIMADEAKASITSTTSAPANSTVIAPASNVVSLPARKHFRMVKGEPVEFTMRDLVIEHPEELAMILDDWGFDVPMLRKEVLERVEQIKKLLNPNQPAPSPLVLPN